MLHASVALQRYVARGRPAFDADPTIRDAMLYQIVVLGEAAKGAIAADPRVTTLIPDVDWSPIARMRDRVAHHYWATDRDVLWATATNAVPALAGAHRDALARLR